VDFHIIDASGAGVGRNQLNPISQKGDTYGIIDMIDSLLLITAVVLNETSRTGVFLAQVLMLPRLVY
jgi:hypothetical protein